jgi:hypothetical protein
MKKSSLLALLVIASTAFAGPSGDFAPSGRILTIVQGGEDEATVWAIQEDQIVIYRVFGFYNRTDEMVTTKPITPDQRKAIQGAVRQIPKGVYGRKHSAAYSTHPPFLGLSVADGDSRPALKTIELEAHVPDWLETVLSTVGSICHPEAPITYPEVVIEYHRHVPKGFDSSVWKHRLLDVHRPARGLYDTR